MKRVKCHSCGKIYDYQKDEICPNCGAYNRPPSHEVVEPDGTVRILEEKVCYEEQTRPKKISHTEGAAEEQFMAQPEVVKKLLQEAQRVTGRKMIDAETNEPSEERDVLPTMTEKQAKLASGLIKFAGVRKKFGFVVAGIIALSIAVSIFQSKQSDYDIDFSEEQAIEMETLQEYRAVGDEIAVDGIPIAVNGASFDGDEISVEVQVGAEEDYYFEPQLYWHDADGYEYTWWPDSWESVGNNRVRQYEFDMEDPIEYGYAANEDGYYLAFYTMADEDTQYMYLIPLGSGNA